MVASRAIGHLRVHQRILGACGPKPHPVNSLRSEGKATLLLVPPQPAAWTCSATQCLLCHLEEPNLVDLDSGSSWPGLWVHPGTGTWDQPLPGMSTESPAGLQLCPAGSTPCRFSWPSCEVTPAWDVRQTPLPRGAPCWAPRATVAAAGGASESSLGSRRPMCREVSPARAAAAEHKAEGQPGGLAPG